MKKDKWLSITDTHGYEVICRSTHISYIAIIPCNNKESCDIDTHYEIGCPVLRAGGCIEVNHSEAERISKELGIELIIRGSEKKTINVGIN